ncbi:restriction endonuclease [Legionella pneumophila serogroup 1]
MTIPTYQECMLPMLKVLKDNSNIKSTRLISLMGDWFHLSDDEREELLSSGRTTILRTRVHWAKVYLKQAGLVEYPKRGYVAITEKEIQVLQKNPSNIDTNYLKKFPDFIRFIERSKTESQQGSNSEYSENYSPDEVLTRTFERMKNQTCEELLEVIKSSSPQFFEKLVVQVIVSLGYGGSLQEAGQAIGKSGDGGVDGVIKEDRLGLELIYLQAKLKKDDKYNVGRPDIQKFYGALQGKQAKKGIFITTTDFSNEAREYLKVIDKKIILLNGKELIELMWEYNIGLNVSATYEVKDLDLDFFKEELE